MIFLGKCQSLSNSQPRALGLASLVLCLKEINLRAGEGEEMRLNPETSDATDSLFSVRMPWALLRRY